MYKGHVDYDGKCIYLRHCVGVWWLAAWNAAQQSGTSRTYAKYRKLASCVQQGGNRHISFVQQFTLASRMASLTKWMNLGQAASSFTSILGQWSFFRNILCLCAEAWAPPRALCRDWLMQRMNWVDVVRSWLQWSGLTPPNTSIYGLLRPNYV